MPNKFELMAEGVIEYKSRMEAAFGEWVSEEVNLFIIIISN